MTILFRSKLDEARFKRGQEDAVSGKRPLEYSASYLDGYTFGYKNKNKLRVL